MPNKIITKKVLMLNNDSCNKSHIFNSLPTHLNTDGLTMEPYREINTDT